MHAVLGPEVVEEQKGNEESPAGRQTRSRPLAEPVKGDINVCRI